MTYIYISGEGKIKRSPQWDNATCLTVLGHILGAVFRTHKLKLIFFLSPSEFHKATRKLENEKKTNDFLFRFARIISYT